MIFQRRIIILCFCIACSFLKARAQNYFIENALLASRTMSSGGARVMALGGAQTALGGDYSLALSNPAGLGAYNRSEYSVSAGFANTNTAANYLGNNFSASKSNLNIPGFSLVFANESNKSGPLKFQGGAFAITFSRQNNFNTILNYEGKNQDNSIIDYFLETAQGYPKSQFDADYNPNYEPIGYGDNVNTPAYLAFNNYLIGPTSINGTDYFTDVTGIPFQSEEIKTSGAQNQWSFSYGANFNDKFYAGAGFGLPSYRYEYSKTYKEDFTGQDMGSPCNTCFNDLQLTEKRQTSARGINLMLGLQFRPIDFLRLGISYTSPTRYQVTDTYEASMTTSWNNFDYYGTPTTPGNIILSRERWETFDDPLQYTLTTPAHINLGAAYFFNKNGFVTGDIEFVNYNNASTSAFTQQKYSLSYDADYDVNDPIKNRFRSTMNYRVGGEYRVKNYRLRAGYNFMSDPYLRQPDTRSIYSLTGISTVSGGVGYRVSKFFVDLAFSYSSGSSFYRPYYVSSAATPKVDFDRTAVNFMATVGFPF